jgi:predicted TIM-barrel fold metal-dependent hydrolase
MPADMFRSLISLKESTLPGSATEPALREVSEWNVFDGNVRVGPSGVHGELALEASDLLAEMDRFGIREALVSHFAAEEYDPEEGNRALAGSISARLEPAWAALPDADFLRQLALRSPRAVRLSFGVKKHNFSWAPWCSGQLYDYLQEHSILTLIVCEDLEWNSLADLLGNFPRLPVLLLEPGYRADRYLFPLLPRHSHLYFDTSTYVAHRQLESFVERFGPERLVFGSRLPLYTPAAALAVLASARISDEARQAIAGGTLRRLLGSAVG